MFGRSRCEMPIYSTYSFYAFSLDRWDFYKEYIETVVQLVKAKSKETPPAETVDNGDIGGNQADTSFDSCHEFLCEVSGRQRNDEIF